MRYRQNTNQDKVFKLKDLSDLWFYIKVLKDTVLWDFFTPILEGVVVTRDTYIHLHTQTLVCMIQKEMFIVGSLRSAGSYF